jgi:hypothetical protein
VFRRRGRLFTEMVVRVIRFTSRDGWTRRSESRVGVSEVVLGDLGRDGLRKQSTVGCLASPSNTRDAVCGNVMQRQATRRNGRLAMRGEGEAIRY